MGRAEPVAVGFATPRGKELEKVTLTSVYALMADMEKTGVGKVRLPRRPRPLTDASLPHPAP